MVHCRNLFDYDQVVNTQRDKVGADVDASVCISLLRHGKRKSRLLIQAGETDHLMQMTRGLWKDMI
jgi:hypothetical protein